MKSLKAVLTILPLMCVCLTAPGASIAAEQAAIEAQTTVAGRHLIDVRTRKEYEKDHIEGAVLMPPEQIATLIVQTVPNRSAPIALYCHSGGRSAAAAKALKAMGYTDVEDWGGIRKARKKLEQATP
jgi:phage shock protein E